MKFTCLTEIYVSREKVVSLWQEPENLKDWQIGFKSYKHTVGKPGKVGSKTILTYSTKSNVFDLEETIIENNLPDVFEGEYVHEKMTNRMRNTFVALGPDATIWKAEIHYTKFNGLGMKLFAFLGKKIFKKQTQKWLDNFKAFAESKL